MQSIELTIGEAVIKVSPETVRDRIVYKSIGRKALQCQEHVEKALGIEHTQDITIVIINYCQVSTRVNVATGKLDMPLLIGTDTIEEMNEKILAFINTSYASDYDELIKTLDRIDQPDIEHLAPGANDKYADMEIEDFDALPESEKKS